MRFLLVLLVLMLSSCDQMTERALGINSQKVQLRGNVLLDSRGLTLSNSKMRALGRESIVCVQLIDITPADQMVNDFDRAKAALRTTTLTGHMQLSDGRVVDFIPVGKQWTKLGASGDPNDLTICLLPEDRWNFVAVLPVRSVTIQANPSIHLRGIYWSSDNTAERFKSGT